MSFLVNFKKGNYIIIYIYMYLYKFSKFSKIKN